MHFVYVYILLVPFIPTYYTDVYETNVTKHRSSSIVVVYSTHYMVTRLHECNCGYRHTPTFTRFSIPMN